MPRSGRGIVALVESKVCEGTRIDIALVPDAAVASLESRQPASRSTSESSIKPISASALKRSCHHDSERTAIDPLLEIAGRDSHPLSHRGAAEYARDPTDPCSCWQRRRSDPFARTI
jgi:hypothetical protein